MSSKVPVGLTNLLGSGCGDLVCRVGVDVSVACAVASPSGVVSAGALPDGVSLGGVSFAVTGVIGMLGDGKFALDLGADNFRRDDIIGDCDRFAFT